MPASALAQDFERRRRRGEDDGGPLDRGAQHGHVAGVVEGAVLLLVRSVVLLVDDDEPEVGEGQEQRRAGADDEPRLAGGDGRPGAAAGGLGHARVPLGRAGAEAGLDPVEELDRERDLRQEHQRLTALRQRLGDGLEVDLGLARAGDAVQQRRRVAAGGDGGAEGGGGPGLRRGKRARDGRGVERRIGGVAGGGLAHEHALGFQALEHGGRDAGEPRELERREAAVAELLEGGEDARPRPGHPRRLGAGAAQQRPRRRRLAEARRAGREPQHHPERGQRVVGGAAQELAHRLAERRGIEHPRHRPQLLRRAVPLSRAPDRAEHPARAERHLDQVAGTRPALGRAIVEQPVEPVRQHHRDRLAGGEDTHQLAGIEVFHRATAWASIAPYHKH